MERLLKFVSCLLSHFSVRANSITMTSELIRYLLQTTISLISGGRWGQLSYTGASKETYHFLGATVTKIHRIKMNHIWIQNKLNLVLLMQHISEKRVACVKKGVNCGKILQKVISRNCSLRELHEKLPFQNIQ